VSEKPPVEGQKVKFHYIKSNLFRVVSGEGAIGSVSPHGKIFFALYHERAAIPTGLTHFVSESGELGEISETETRGGIVRELEVGVLMDLADAIQLRDWLGSRISELQDVFDKHGPPNVHLSSKPK
jgi:hypothetical protein